MNGDEKYRISDPVDQRALNLGPARKCGPSETVSHLLPSLRDSGFIMHAHPALKRWAKLFRPIRGCLGVLAYTVAN